jgi:hypothetical protein
MPIFATWSGRVPGFSFDERGMLHQQGGEPVLVQMVASDCAVAHVWLGLQAPDSAELAYFLNRYAGVHGNNELVATNSVARELRPQLKGPWTFRDESPDVVGPTRCFATLMGFLHEAFDARAGGQLLAQGTAAQWSAALSSMLPGLLTISRHSAYSLEQALAELDAQLQ